MTHFFTVATAPATAASPPEPSSSQQQQAVFLAVGRNAAAGPATATAAILVLSPGRRTRHLLTAAGCALAAVLLAGQVRTLLSDPTVWPPDDFVEYWAAARLTLDGQNPYDPALLLPLQQAAGRATDEAVMMWNPPWSLAVVLPLGLVPARVAQLLWLLANLAAVGYCGDRLWLLAG